MIKNQLTEKRKKFCKEYIKDYNSAQAAIRAGFSKKTARTQGSLLLTKIDIQLYLKDLQDKQNKRLESESDEIVKELRNIGLSDITDTIKKIKDDELTLEDLKTLPIEIRRTIKSITIDKQKMGAKLIHQKIKLGFHDKVRALEILERRSHIFDGSEIPVDGFTIKIIKNK